MAGSVCSGNNGRMGIMKVSFANNLKERTVRFYQEKPLEFSLGLTFLYTLIVLYGALHHEMWRDEIQAWLIARDSASILELLKNLKYEGHPGLWHLMLFFISRVSADPFMMQVLHLAIASLCVFLFVRYSPFGLAIKLLFPFGVLPLYHYSVLSRNYSMGMLFSFAVCALYGKRFEKFPLIVFFLILLANSNIFAFMLSGSFMLIFVCEHFANSRKFTRGKLNGEVSGSESRRYADFYPCVLAYGIFCVAEIICLIPPTDSAFAVGWDTKLNSIHLASVFSRILAAYIPVFFAPVFFSSALLKVASALLGLSLFIFFLALLRRSTYSLIFLFSSTASTMLFMYLKYLGYFRHHVNLFVALLVSLWIASMGASKPSLRAKTAAGLILLFIFFTHVIVGVYAYSLDIRNDYSMAKEVSLYVKKEGLEALPVIGSPDYAASSLAGYMRKNIYYPELRREGSFVVWNRERELSFDWRWKEKGVLDIAVDRTRLDARDELLIINFPLDLNADYVRTQKDVKIVFLRNFTGSIMVDESYWIYKISPHASMRY